MDDWKIKFITAKVRIRRGHLGCLSLFFVALVPLFAFGQFHSALASCRNSGMYRNPALDLRFLENAAVICDVEKDPKCEKDNRETFEEAALARKTSAEALHDKYSGTVAFYCGNTPMGTANVVRRNDLVVLSAHQFFHDDGSCKPKMPGRDFSSCYFETIGPRGEPGEKHYLKSASLEVGTECPGKFNIGDDWAVVKLAQDIKGVRPYRAVNAGIFKNAKGNFAALSNAPATVVSTMNQDFEKNGRKLPLRTPTICEDSIRWVQTQSDTSKSNANYIVSACSASGGNSGAGIFMRSDGNAAPALVGIVNTTDDSTMNRKPFGPNNNTNGALLEGRFYKTLMDM